MLALQVPAVESGVLCPPAHRGWCMVYGTSTSKGGFPCWGAVWGSRSSNSLASSSTGTGFQRLAGSRKQSKVPPYTPHHRRSACQSHVCMVFGFWLDNFVRSPLRCEVAFSSLSLQRRCVYPQLDSKGASMAHLLQGKRIC
jgi:hypothetical protein